MKFEAEQVLCRFHLSSGARHGLEPLYEWIVESAHREGLQGATVLKGFLGLRPDGTLLAESAWTLSQELPVIVEVVDTPGSLARLLALVEPVFQEGCITLERAHVVRYRAGSPSGPQGHPTARTPGDIAVIATKDQSVAGEVTTMKQPQDGVLLRIFIGESHRAPGSDMPLHHDIVMRAKAAQLAGATALRGPLGFGRHSRLHAAKLLELSTDLPVVIEIVDSEEKITGFLPVLDELVIEGLVTLEAVRVIKYGPNPS